MMMKRLALALFLFPLFLFPFWAGAAQPEVPAITVTGHGEVRVAPDMAVLRFGTVAEAQEAAEAQERAGKATARAVAALRQAGVPEERIQWIVDDVRTVPATGFDFVYLYRPLRPDGAGREFYERFASEVESEPSPPVIFSIADCLRDFLSERYEVVYGDGHLTCFKPR